MCVVGYKVLAYLKSDMHCVPGEGFHMMKASRANNFFPSAINTCLTDTLRQLAC